MESQHDEKLWTFLERVVAETGAKLFDVELPSARQVSEEDEDGSVAGGVLRVFITRGADTAAVESGAVGSGGSDAATTEQEGTTEESGLEIAQDEGTPKRHGVSLDQCARVAKRLLDLDEEESFVPDGCELQVSSPGINRRLRRPEHFSSAVGERVKVKFRNESGGMQVVTGVINSCLDNVLCILNESTSAEVSMPLASIKEARVDFRFG